MNTTDDDKLEKYSEFADTLRKVHKATDGSATHFLQNSVMDDEQGALWSDESFYAIKGDDGREYIVGAPGLYLAAAEVIEDLVARAKEAREDF